MSIQMTNSNRMSAELDLGVIHIQLDRGALRDLIKRLADVTLSIIALVLLAPLMAAVGLLVIIDGGPAFYAHPRVGKDGRSFGCLKFRTMILGANECLEEYFLYNPEARQQWDSSHKLTFDPRMTSIGRFLRESSLDELPQFLNVLIGDMSLVGPRPVTEAELAKYGAKADLYKMVRPGVTGPWQISGRNDVSYDRRVEMDSEYVADHSFRGDVAILLRTPAAVISRKGAN